MEDFTIGFGLLLGGKRNLSLDWTISYRIASCPVDFLKGGLKREETSF